MCQVDCLLLDCIKTTMKISHYLMRKKWKSHRIMNVSNVVYTDVLVSLPWRVSSRLCLSCIINETTLKRDWTCKITRKLWPCESKWINKKNAHSRSHGQQWRQIEKRALLVDSFLMSFINFKNGRGHINSKVSGMTLKIH